MTRKFERDCFHCLEEQICRSTTFGGKARWEVQSLGLQNHSNKARMYSKAIQSRCSCSSIYIINCTVHHSLACCLAGTEFGLDLIAHSCCLTTEVSWWRNVKKLQTSVIVTWALAEICRMPIYIYFNTVFNFEYCIQARANPCGRMPMIFQASIFGLSLCADVICRSAWSIWYQCCLYSLDMPGQSETSRMLFSYFWTNSHAAVTARILESEAWLFVGVLFHLGGSLSRSSIDPSPRWGRPLHIISSPIAHVCFNTVFILQAQAVLVLVDTWYGEKSEHFWPLTLFIAQHFSVQSDNILSFIPFAKSSWYISLVVGGKDPFLSVDIIVIASNTALQWSKNIRTDLMSRPLKWLCKAPQIPFYVFLRGCCSLGLFPSLSIPNSYCLFSAFVHMSFILSTVYTFFFPLFSLRVGIQKALCWACPAPLWHSSALSISHYLSVATRIIL